MYINKICLILFVCFGLRLNGWGQSITKSGIIYTATGENTASVTGVSSRLVGSKTIEDQVVIAGKSRKVTAISYQAFADQVYLRRLTMPAQLDSIGIEAFSGCFTLQELNGLENVIYIGNYAFAGTALTEIDMSGWTVKRMGSGVFSGCTLLTQAQLPTTLTTLPARTFSRCYVLQHTNMAELSALKTIEQGAFAGCRSLTELRLPESLTTMKEMACDGMSSLSEIELPKALVNIGDYAFRGCSALTTLTLPEKLTTLGVSPFYGCSSLRRVTLSSYLKNISDNFVFDRCTALESIEIPSLNTLYSSVDGVLYNRTKTQIVAWPSALSHSVHPILPSSSSPLAKGALIDCELDEQMWLPARMKTLPSDALTRTSGMKGIAAEKGSLLNTIEARAVSNSKDLEVVELPSTLRQLGEAAFQGCTAVKDVITKSAMPPSAHISSFDNDVYSQACLHVRQGAKTAFGNQAVWGNFINIVEDAMTTDVQVIPGHTENRPAYDLCGRRVKQNPVDGRPLRKGIYIIGGRKIVK